MSYYSDIIQRWKNYFLLYAVHKIGFNFRCIDQLRTIYRLFQKNVTFVGAFILYLVPVVYQWPITVAARSKAWMGSNPTRGMNVCIMCVYSVCVALCVGRGLATGWSPVQGVLPTVNKDKETEKADKVQQRDVEPWMDGWVGGWMDGWTDGRTDGILIAENYSSKLKCSTEISSSCSCWRCLPLRLRHEPRHPTVEVAHYAKSPCTCVCSL
jgi:hypothetical protein